MDIMQAMAERHSVRQYKPVPLTDEHVAALEGEIAAINQEAELHFQLVKNEPKAFDCLMAHYGSFRGVTNYIALVGKKSDDLVEKCGYYGERLVLFAQALGMNTCWVAATYKKVPNAFTVETDEKLTVVIAIGYGETQGVPHKNKALAAVCNAYENAPEWFKKGMDAVMLAPTAINQQKFYFTVEGNEVSAVCKSHIWGEMDLGIAKYHFELGAGKENFTWKN